MGTGTFPEVERQGRGVEHPPLSSAEVKERVLSPWDFVAYSRENFTFTLPIERRVICGSIENPYITYFPVFPNITAGL